MELSDTEIELIQKHEAKFVSLKYLDSSGTLKQIDVSTKNLLSKVLSCGDSFIALKTIKNKHFIDPFRSMPTVSFFCEKNTDKDNARQILIKKISSKNSLQCLNSKIEARINFWINPELERLKALDSCTDYNLIADPADRYSNLRSEIVNVLESINIQTTRHFHGTLSSESSIGIIGSNIVDLADNIMITKFIITNVAESYGIQAKLSFSSKNNLSIIISGCKEDLNVMQKNLPEGLISNVVSGISSYCLELNSSLEDQSEPHLLFVKLFS